LKTGKAGDVPAGTSPALVTTRQLISIRFTWRRASGFLARMTGNTPILNVALTLSGSTSSPSVALGAERVDGGGSCPEDGVATGEAGGEGLAVSRYTTVSR